MFSKVKVYEEWNLYSIKGKEVTNPGGSMGEESACTVGDTGDGGFDPWVGKGLLRSGNGNSLHILLEKSLLGQRKSGWVQRKRSQRDRTELSD